MCRKSAAALNGIINEETIRPVSWHSSWSPRNLVLWYTGWDVVNGESPLYGTYCSTSLVARPKRDFLTRFDRLLILATVISFCKLHWCRNQTCYVYIDMNVSLSLVYKLNVIKCIAASTPYIRWTQEKNWLAFWNDRTIVQSYAVLSKTIFRLDVYYTFFIGRHVVSFCIYYIVKIYKRTSSTQIHR